MSDYNKNIEQEDTLEMNSSKAEVAEVDGHSKRALRIAAFGVLGVLALGIVSVAAWYFLIRGGEGEAVPAPRDTSFGTGSGENERLASGEQRLTLTDDQLKSAGLKIVEVGETLDAAASSETTTGVVRSNEYEETPIIAQVNGIVKVINADLGQFVRRGETIAVLQSEELSEAQSKYLLKKANLEEAEKRYRRSLDLSRISEESRNELDRQTASQKAAEARLIEAKSNHQRSRKLVDIGAISRREFEMATTALKTAEANAAEAKKRLERARRLLKIDPARRNEIDRFEANVKNLRAETAAMREKLLVLGLSKRRVDALRSPSQISANLPVLSPISGTVTERTANRNEVVSMNSKLAMVTNLSTVWVIGQVYEKDLGKLRVGSGASITTDAYPGQIFRGQISYIDPNLDERTRTARVRIEIPNPDQKLKIGQFVNVAYSRLGGSEKTTPLVSKNAVQSVGSEKIVFQATDDPKTFVLRRVRLGREKEAGFSIVEGIFVGDRVVTDGSFLLRAEWLKTNSASF